jgi:hypothetical protein
MASDLQEARLRLVDTKHRLYDWEAADAAYTAAFRKYGLDVDGLDPATAAGLIQARPIHYNLVATPIRRIRRGRVRLPCNRTARS